jgi:hypothetical protein
MKNNPSGPHPSKAFRDLASLIAVTIFMLVLSYYFDVFGLIVQYLQKHPDKIVYVDEVIVTLVTLSTGLAIFAWRRWLELKKLLKLTSTQAEVERIISKQLRSDMEQMKLDVQEILRLLISKLKR